MKIKKVSKFTLDKFEVLRFKKLHVIIGGGGTTAPGGPLTGTDTVKTDQQTR